jgi:hypothetical protein
MLNSASTCIGNVYIWHVYRQHAPAVCLRCRGLGLVLTKSCLPCSAGPVYTYLDELDVVHSSRFGLAFLLLHEAKNTSSFWRPYLCALPRRPAAPFLLKATELRELLLSVVAITCPHTPPRHKYIGQGARVLEGMLPAHMRAVGSSSRAASTPYCTTTWHARKTRRTPYTAPLQATSPCKTRASWLARVRPCPRCR